MPMQNCVCAGRGGGHICVCMRQVYRLLCVYVPCTPQTHCDNLFFFFYLFYLSRLQGFVFQHGLS